MFAVLDIDLTARDYESIAKFKLLVKEGDDWAVLKSGRNQSNRSRKLTKNYAHVLTLYCSSKLSSSFCDPPVTLMSVFEPTSLDECSTLGQKYL